MELDHFTVSVRGAGSGLSCPGNAAIGLDCHLVSFCLMLLPVNKKYFPHRHCQVLGHGGIVEYLYIEGLDLLYIQSVMR